MSRWLDVYMFKIACIYLTYKNNPSSDVRIEKDFCLFKLYKRQKQYKFKITCIGIKY